MREALKNKAKVVDGKISSFFEALRIKNPKLQKLVSVIVFLVALHCFYSYLGVYNHIHERPCSIHASAQCQRASIAYNYYRVDMNFFKPRIQRFRYDDGITGVEFPVIYYTAAVLYKYFGFNETYLRVISLLIISAGFLLFYLLVNGFLQNIFLSLVITGAALLSPVLLFYSPNFMPDAPALGFMLGSWFFFFRYINGEKKVHLVLFVLFGALAALIKAVSLMGFAVVLCLLLLDKLKFFKKEAVTHLFKRRAALALGVVAGVLVVMAWYGYTQWLSKTYRTNSFALQPVLVSDMETLRQVYHFVRHTWLFQYYPYEAYMLLICAVTVILLNLKRVNKLLLTITALYFIGSLCYAYLFLNQFMHHDYYIIAMLPTVFFLLLTFGDVLNRLSIRYTPLISVLFFIIIFFNMKENLLACKENYSYRYNSKVYLGGEYRPYYDLAPRLEAIGLTREDKVVSAFDDSYTNSLYFMNQPGFTIENCYEHDTIQNSLKVPGVTYLVVSDSAKFNKVYPNNFDKKIVLIHRGLIVYKLN